MPQLLSWTSVFPSLSPEPGVANWQMASPEIGTEFPCKGLNVSSLSCCVAELRLKAQLWAGLETGWGWARGSAGKSCVRVHYTLRVSPHFRGVLLLWKSCEDASMQSPRGQCSEPKTKCLVALLPLCRYALAHQAAPSLHLNALCPSFLLGTEQSAALLRL